LATAQAFIPANSWFWISNADGRVPGRDSIDWERHVIAIKVTDPHAPSQSDIVIIIVLSRGTDMSNTETGDSVVATALIPTLKASPDLLARAFLDILSRAAGAETKPLLRNGNPKDSIEQLLDDLSGSSDPDNPNLDQAGYCRCRNHHGPHHRGRPRVDQGITAKAFPSSRSPPMDAELVALVAEVLGECAYGSDIQVLQGKQYGSNRQHRNGLTFVRDGTENGHKPDKGNDLVASALHAQSPIIGIAPEPRRHLPRDLMRTAEHHLILGEIDERAIALVIEAVTGHAPDGTIDPELVHAANVNDLQLAVRKHQTPDDCLRRLAKIIRKKDIFDDSVHARGSGG